MSAFAAVAIALVAVAIVEIAAPGYGVYHRGWFNVALVALGAIAIALARSALAGARGYVASGAILAVALGALVAALATAASGLLAPDNRTIVGAPGQRVRVDDLEASLVFPPADATSQLSATAVVLLDRKGRAPLAIGGSGRFAGAFALRPRPRTVVFVDARDLRGARLTVTQPSGAAFLSPVLLMQQHQTIAGFDVPFDSFAVPAAHRLVRAVLFTPQQAALMRGLEGGAGAAVLFAVDDESDRPLPHGVDAVRSGATIAIDGLLLRAFVFDYPAIDIVPIPPLPAAIASVALVVGGLLLAARRRGSPVHDGGAPNIRSRSSM